jgi:hypothetical protein
VKNPEKKIPTNFFKGGDFFLVENTEQSYVPRWRGKKGVEKDFRMKNVP